MGFGAPALDPGIEEDVGSSRMRLRGGAIEYESDDDVHSSKIGL